MRKALYLAGLSSLAGWAAPVSADLTFCNETNERASVAVGYSDDGVWTSEGWWRVEPGECRATIRGKLPRKYYYWRATSRDGVIAEGKYFFCTQSDPFTIRGDKNCKDRGYDRVGFREQNIGDAVDYTIELVGTVATDPPRSDKGPGTFGEPYTVVARFRGCWAVNEDLECEFEADGWRYVASEAGPTDPAIIQALGVFSDGMRLQISGDLISYEGDRAEVTIREVEAAPPMAPSAPAPRASVSMNGLMDHMQGFWDSDAGDGYTWIVEGNFLREIYDANIMRESYFEIATSCAASNGQGPFIIAWPEPDQGEGPSCYVVTETAQRHLAVYDVLEGRRFSFSYSN